MAGGIFSDDFYKQHFEIDLTVGGGDDAAILLQGLIDHMKRLGVGSEESKTAVKNFLKELGELGPAGALAGKSLKDIERNMRSVVDVLYKNGLGVYGNLAKTALGQQANWIPGSTRAQNESMLAKFKGGESIPGGDDPKWLRGLRTVSMMTAAVQQLGRVMKETVEQTAKSSREILQLAQSAQTSINEISKLGGALEAFGGNKGQAGNFLRNYQLEYAKMLVGQGIGGKYMESARLYGIRYDPRDPKSFLLEVAKKLADPNVSGARKVGLASTVGLSAQEQLLYSRGPEAVKAEWARQESLHTNTERAAKATQEYDIATQHLSAAIVDLKNSALAPLTEALTPLIEKFSEFIQWITESKWGPAVGTLILLVGALGKLTFVLAKFRAVFRMAGWIGNAAGAAGSAAGSVGGGGGGSAAGGLASGVGALAGAVVGLTTEAVLIDIRALLNSWFAIWCVMNGATQNRSAANRVIDAAFQDLPNFGLGRMSTKSRELFANNMAYENYYRQAANRESLIMFNRSKEENKAGSQITIEQIDINIDGGVNDPVEIADAVNENLLNSFRNVVINMEAEGMA